MAKPWTDGPRELIEHAIGHIALGRDADRRFAFISIDNAVELMVKTYLGLPTRARQSRGPTRKQLDEASESFPSLLSLLEEFAASEIVGLDLDDIEWYHRLRNQLYHSGNGITVEAAKVEAYLQLALTLFENLFDERIVTDSTEAAQTRTGQFLALWNEFQIKCDLFYLTIREDLSITGSWMFWRKLTGRLRTYTSPALNSETNLCTESQHHPLRKLRLT